MKRRNFLAMTATAGLGAIASGLEQGVVVAQTVATPKTQGTNPMPQPFEQPKLPYELDALSPFLSDEQMMYHYNKHHAAYFNNLNKLVDGKPEAKMSLEKLIVEKDGGIFNNAAQAWNHTFFWNCMSPKGGGAPTGKLAEAINRDFGTYTGFAEKFVSTATTLFGSGWAWLAADQSGSLELMALSNADTPLKHGKTAVLTIDVWEHAYYVDYRNERAKFIAAFMEKINWPFAEKCYNER